MQYIGPLQILLFLVAILGINIYFIPAYVGWWRKKKARWVIFLVNLFLGWTVIGWIGSLVWAVIPDSISTEDA